MGLLAPTAWSYARVCPTDHYPMMHTEPAERPQGRGPKRGPTVKKAFPIALMVLGLIFVGASVYTMNRGFDAKRQVKNELVAQDITIGQRFDKAGKVVDEAIPAKWAGKQVNSAASAKAQADIINHHALKATGGKTYAELDKTDPTRTTAFNASMLRTSLYTSIMAFNVGDLVIGLGLMILVLGLAVGGLGVALGALAIPSLASRFHVAPVVTDAHPAV